MSRYKPYPKYKESGVEWLGEVPEHWEISKLKFYLLSIIAGGTPQTSNNDNWCESGFGIPWVSIADMTKNNRINQTKKNITTQGILEKNLKILPKGTILYSIFASLGKVALANVPLTTNQAILGLLPTKNINKFFLYWLLINLEGYVKYVASSNTQENLNAEKVSNFPLSLPSLQEQTAIANFLDRETAKIDTLIAKQEQLIELLQEKRQALISHTVTKGLNPHVRMKDSGISWIGKIPEHWKMMKIKYWGIYKSGDFIAANQIESDGKYPVMGGNGLRGYTNTYNTNGNYVLIGRQGALCGNINYASGKFWATEHAIVVFHNKRIDNIQWLGLMLQTMNLNQYSTSAAQPGLAIETIINLESILPPKEEQQQIADYLDTQTAKIDTLIVKAKQAIELLKERREALISAAVTGKIDLQEESM